MSATKGPAPRRTPARLARWLLLVVLLLVLVFYAGGGWYFSSRIHSDALEVTRYPDENHLSVSPGPDGTLSIGSDDPGELTMLRAPSTFGVTWSHGYGRVSGPVVSQDRAHVVRRFQVVTGEAPRAHTVAGLDLVAFPEDPTFALGPQVRDVTYTSPLGRFPAWFVPAKGAEDGTWAILVHGKGGTRTEMFRMTRAMVAAGLPALDISYRNDEGLPADPSGEYRFGATEWQDLRGAVAYAAAHGAQRVVLGADSMGGSIVASYLEHRGSAGPPVSGLVLDAPMLDLGDTVRFGARQIELPLIGPVPDSLTWTAERLATVRYDVHWRALDYLDDTSWVRMPTLLFHGTADTTVPVATSRELARDVPARVTLVETAGVEHVRSWNADPRAYDARISRFVHGL